MNREYLKGLGLEDGQIDSVMKEYGKSVNAIKEKADSVGGLESQIEDYKGQLTERDEQLEDLKKVDPKALQSEIETLKEANASTATEYQGKLATQQKQFALETALRDAKARDPKLALSALGLDLDAVLIKEGVVVGLDGHITALKESHDYLFEADEGETGSGNPNYSTGNHSKGSGSGGNNPFNKDSFNLTEQGRLLRDEPERFKQLKAQAK